MVDAYRKFEELTNFIMKINERKPVIEDAINRKYGEEIRRKVTKGQTKIRNSSYLKYII